MYTKAETLLYLKEKLHKAHILPPMMVWGRDMENPQSICDSIKKQFSGGKIVVRSSCSKEDGENSSNAGHYDSIIGVNPLDDREVENAINQVFDSYKRDLDDIKAEHVLIQQQLEQVDYSGVIFTRDINKNRPYYVISYEAASTDAVTSGAGGKTLYIARNTNLSDVSALWQPLLMAVCEIEEIFGAYPLDIEFALVKDEVYIFQVRPFVAGIRNEAAEAEDSEIFDAIQGAKKEYIRISEKLLERNAILSDMAFWNPAEIIGINPHPLDYSLYRDIITRSAWNQGLDAIGYREVDGDLMYKVGNRPYISLKQSFCCLMPSDIDSHLAEKLLAYYNNKLLRDITAHDKIEFEIVFGAYDFMTHDKLSELASYGFPIEYIQDLEDALFNMTDKAVKNFEAGKIRDLKALNGLKVHRENIESNWKMCRSELHTLIDYFMELLESIKHYGTPKFARQARLAFIAKSLCKSMVLKGYFSEEEMENFMRSLYTVASEYEEDVDRLSAGDMTRESFDAKYGHLRSGTYDITCPTYREMEVDFGKTGRNRTQRGKAEALDIKTLERAVRDIGFDISPERFGAFLKDSLEEREYFKFEFTKALSLAIDILICAGESLGISRADMAYLTVYDIFNISGKSCEEIGAFWNNIIKENKNIYRINSALVLPDVLYSKNQISEIYMMDARPNFITSRVVTGQVALLDEMTEINEMPDIRDKIVVISKADPGYDWIFAAGIKGFVTRYGGVASHMAIRCGEFGIPAAIGCGDVIYDYVAAQDVITIDCVNKRIFREE
jgi:phosphohistidine swiveling domain-containing protein